jgi:hypothetical protein
LLVPHRREVSDRQWRYVLGVLGVLKAQACDLDIEDLRAWTARAGVADLLARAVAESR